MHVSRGIVSTLVIVAIGLTAIAGPQKQETVTLPAYKHEFYWEEFSVSRISPVSPDGHYRLKQVLGNGEVEMFYAATSEREELIVVKPMPKKFRDGDHPPTIVVVDSNHEKQEARLRELRMK